MQNSHIAELSELIHCILKDATMSFPHLRAQIEFDLRNLDRSVKARGVPLLVEDLPKLGKALDKGLASGHLDCTGLPLSKKATPRTSIPRFLFGLWAMVFDGAGTLREDYDAEAIFFLRQILFLGKRSRINCSEENVNREVDSFFELDLELPEPEEFWLEGSAEAQEVYRGFKNSSLCQSRVADAPEFGGRRSILGCVDQVFRILIASMGSFSPYDWRPKHGPGAVAEVSGKKDKYSFDNWSPQLERVFPCADFAFHNASAWATNHEELGEVERPSRLIAVPKTLSKPRLIAAEPSENMWCQQILWHYFRERTAAGLIGKFIHFRDQTRNQRMCKRGSVDGDLCTIDLSAASDRVTCHVVGQAFRWNKDLLSALQATRTQRIVWQKCQTTCKRGDGDFLDVALAGWRETSLRKFTTMGSACTFPVESVVFLGLALAATLWKRKLPVSRSTILSLEDEVSVFGDDIIVPKDAWVTVKRLLETLWFKVNADKSFGTGLFRESCGVDSIGGVEITPTYWSAPINRTGAKSVAGYIAMRNNFYSKFLLHTSEYLTKQIPENFRSWVSSDSDLPGIRSFVRPSRLAHRNVRWNRDLHRMEAKVYAIRTRLSCTPAQNDAALLRYFTEAPSPFTDWSSDVPLDVLVQHQHRWVDLSELQLK